MSIHRDSLDSSPRYYILFVALFYSPLIYLPPPRLSSCTSEGVTDPNQSNQPPESVTVSFPEINTSLAKGLVM